MLFKAIVQQYGAFLSSGARPDKDPIGFIVPEEETSAFRKSVMDDIGAATVYVLDDEAADYLDSFREDVMGGASTDEASAKIAAFLSEVDLPEDVIWLEYNHASLFEKRIARGHLMERDGYTKQDFGQRGFLIDNRSADHLQIAIFRITDGKIIDPMIRLQFAKETGGGTVFRECMFLENPHMGLFYAHANVGQRDFEDMVSQEFGDTTYDSVLAFMLFAVLSSSNEGITTDCQQSLTSKEQRTARKFGKTWLVDKVREHVVIHIGEPGRRHLEEQSARKKHERAAMAERLAPVEHWVAEHERRYKSGKIVTVKAHKRGNRVDPAVPRLVKGPASAGQT